MLASIQDTLQTKRQEWGFPAKFCLPCPSRLARLQAPPSLSLLSSALLSSACDERISCEDDFRAGMEVRVLFEGENRNAAERKKKERASEGKKGRRARDGDSGEREQKRVKEGDNWRRWLKEAVYPDWSSVQTQWNSEALPPKLAKSLNC